MGQTAKRLKRWISHAGFTLIVWGAAHADAAVRFSAEFMQESVEEDQSAELRITYEIEDGGTSAETPQFRAPDFDLLMESPSFSVQSSYDSTRGRFGQRVIRRFTYVLKPSRTGVLKVTGIRGRVDQQSFTAPDLQLRVHPSGSGMSGSSQMGRNQRGSVPAQRGSVPPGNLTGKGPEFFTRVEVEPRELYKGQQAVVSYFLYVRSDTQAELGRVYKFPVLKGFFREELEMPVVQGNAPNEQVVHNGIPYVKHLLMRYAAYPLKEGNAIVDELGLTIRYTRSVQPPGMGGEDEEDPFDPFGAFRRMVPGFGNAMGIKTWTQGNTKSDTARLEVLPLPKDGKPQGFSGLVGQFSVTTAVDRTELTAGQPVTVVVKVEGRGNLSGLKPLDYQWPAGFEKYETKSQHKTGKDGLSQKIFETLVIPRKSGEFSIPPALLTFFDPESGRYQEVGTDPLLLKVADAGVLSQNSGAALPSGASDPALLTPGGGTASHLQAGQITEEDLDASLAAAPAWQRWLRKLTWAVWVFAGIFAVATGVEWGVRRRKAKQDSARARGGVWTSEKNERWQKLRTQFTVAATRDWETIRVALDELRAALLEEIERLLPGQGVRGMSRSELLQSFQGDQWGLSPSDLEVFEKTLSLAEDTGFAIRAGVIAESQVRAELLPRYTDALSLARKLAEIPLETPKSTPTPV